MLRRAWEKGKALVMAGVAMVLGAGPAMATATPSYTVDFSQVQLDVTTVITALIAVTLVIAGGRKVVQLVKRI